VSSRERQELFSDPPEHAQGDELDSIGLSEGGRRPTSRRRRPGSERVSRHGNERDSDSSTGGRSKREKQARAKRQVRKLIPVGVLLGLIILGIVAWQIPGWIRGGFLGELSSSDAYTRENAVLNLSDPASASALQARLQGGKFSEAGGAAAVALARIDPRRSTAGLEALTAAAGSKDPEVRLSAAHGLGLYGQPQAVATLAKLLKEDDKKIVRAQAARSLGMIKSPESVAALISQAQSQKEVRDAALAALLTAACPAARDELVKGLGAPSSEMRAACRRALIATDQDRQVSATDIAGLLASEEDAVRAGAISFLALSGNGKLFEDAVNKALTDKSEVVRAAAAEAIGLREWKSLAGKLEKLVSSAEEKAKVKTAAAKALGEMRKLTSVPALASLLADTAQEEVARLAAADALVAICKAKHNSFMRQVGTYEEDERASHLAVALEKPDMRWKLLEQLVAACPSFKSKELKSSGFAAMKALCGRFKLAEKPEVWKTWMENKLADARVLGQISKLLERAYEIKKKKDPASLNQAFAMVVQAMKLAKGLRKKADKDDEKYFQGLFEDLCKKIRLDPKKELLKADVPEKKEAAGEKKEKEEKQD
jgi:HEAT repeat protein